MPELHCERHTHTAAYAGPSGGGLKKGNPIFCKTGAGNDTCSICKSLTSEAEAAAMLECRLATVTPCGHAER